MSKNTGEDNQMLDDSSRMKHDADTNTSRRTSHRVRRTVNMMSDCSMKLIRSTRSSAYSKHTKSNTKPEGYHDTGNAIDQSDSKTNKDVNIAAASYSKRLDQGEVQMVDAETDYDLRSVGLLTEPENLGPCEPGTPVCLEGIVWQETSNGVLVVNVTWKGKSYMGTLIDSTKHDWSPPFRGEDDSGFSDVRMMKGRGKRSRVPLSEMFQDINERKLRKEFRQSAAAKKNAVKADREIEIKSDGDCEPAAKRNKRNNSTRFIHCPNSHCMKKFKQLNGLKYHMKNSHQDIKLEKQEAGKTLIDEHSPKCSPNDTYCTPTDNKPPVSSSTVMPETALNSLTPRTSSVPLAAVPPQINLTKPGESKSDQPINLVSDNAKSVKPSTLSESYHYVARDSQTSETASSPRLDVQMLRMAPISTISRQSWHNLALQPIQPKPIIFGDSSPQSLSQQRQFVKNERQLNDGSINKSHQQTAQHSQENHRHLPHRPSIQSHSLLHHHKIKDVNTNATSELKPKERQLHSQLQMNSISDITNDMITKIINGKERLKSEHTGLTAQAYEQNRQRPSTSPFPSRRSDLCIEIPNSRSHPNILRNGHTFASGNHMYSTASHRNYSMPSTTQVPSQHSQDNKQPSNSSQSEELSMKPHKFDCNFNHVGTKPADKRLRELNSSMSQMISTSTNGAFPVDPKLYPSHMPESSLQSAMMMRVLNNLHADSMKRSSLPAYTSSPRK